MQVKETPCDLCKNEIRKYSDGMILKNFTAFEEEEYPLLEESVDRNRFYTYWECKKNSKKMQYLNLTGCDCKGYEKK